MDEKLYPEKIHDLLGYDGLKIIQRDDLFCFSLDSVLLADFVKVTPRIKSILDFGTGLGPIPLFLSLKTKAQIIGVEIQSELCRLARKSVELNQLSAQIEIVEDDIREVHSRFLPSSFDLITCNPPFFKNLDPKTQSEQVSIRIAKHEITVDLKAILQQARRLLKTGGRLVLVHRAERLEDVMLCLQNEHFSLKRIRFVHPRLDENAVTVLLEAANNGKPGSLEVVSPLMIYGKDGQYTDEVLQIFRRKSEVTHGET